MATQVRLEAVLDAKDNASAKIKKFDLSLGKLAGGVALGTIAANALSKATGFLTDTIKGSIEAAREEEVATAKVNAIVATLTGSMEDNKAAIQAASDAAMKLGFDDEDAAISMAKLLQVTGDTTLAQQAMANAQDLARFKGIDLEAATQAVGLAMQGNTKILKQLGIEIPENASKMELMGLIQDKVRGQAEAFGNTAAGAQQKLAVSMENVKEKFGAALATGLTPFINKLTEWISKPETMAFIERFAFWVGRALEVLFDLGQKAIPVVVAGAKALKTAWDAVTNTLANVIYSFMQIWEAIKNIKNAIGDKIGDVKSSIGNFFSSINPFRAQGGMISQGQPTIVGERGPELFFPSGSGRVVPNGKVGGSVTVNFNNPVVRSEDDMKRLINELHKALNESGRLVHTGAL